MSRYRSFTVVMSIILLSMMLVGCGSTSKGTTPTSESGSSGGKHTMPDGSKMDDKNMKK